MYRHTTEGRPGQAGRSTLHRPRRKVRTLAVGLQRGSARLLLRIADAFGVVLDLPHRNREYICVWAEIYQGACIAPPEVSEVPLRDHADKWPVDL